MDIYVQSSGFSQGYCWLKLDVNENQYDKRQDPPIPASFTDLIDTDAGSLILGRSKGKLILLVTGLKTSERIDNRNRPIRNSVVWIGDKFDEKIIQSLTVQALRDNLQEIIDKAVKSEGENSFGFTILIDERFNLKSSGIQGSLNPVQKAEFARLSSDNKEKLADEISKLKSFPDRKLLVAVTGIRSNKYLQKHQVWRGLSTLIDEDGNSLSKEKDSNPIIEDKNINFRQRLKDTFKLYSKGFVLIALVMSLSVSVLLVQQWTAQNQEIKSIKSKQELLQKQRQEIDKQIQELQRQRQEIDKQIQNLELLIKEKHRW